MDVPEEPLGTNGYEFQREQEEEEEEEEEVEEIEIEEEEDEWERNLESYFRETTRDEIQRQLDQELDHALQMAIDQQWKQQMDNYFEKLLQPQGQVYNDETETTCEMNMMVVDMLESLRLNTHSCTVKTNPVTVADVNATIQSVIEQHMSDKKL